MGTTYTAWLYTLFFPYEAAHFVSACALERELARVNAAHRLQNTDTGTGARNRARHQLGTKTRYGLGRQWHVPSVHQRVFHPCDPNLNVPPMKIAALWD